MQRTGRPQCPEPEAPLPQAWSLPSLCRPLPRSPGTGARPGPHCQTRLHILPASTPNPSRPAPPPVSFSAPSTFDVGARDAPWPLGAEAWLVVPCTVGLLGILVLAAAHLRVGVVEVAVDGWGEGHCQAAELAREPAPASGPRAPVPPWGCRPPREKCCSRACRLWPRGGLWAGAGLTAEVWGPPVHTHALVQAGLGVGGHGVTQALAVPAGVTPTRVAHAGLIVRQAVHLRGPALSVRPGPGSSRPPLP